MFEFDLDPAIDQEALESDAPGRGIADRLREFRFAGQARRRNRSMIAVSKVGRLRLGAAILAISQIRLRSSVNGFYGQSDVLKLVSGRMK